MQLKQKKKIQPALFPNTQHWQLVGTAWTMLAALFTLGSPTIRHVVPHSHPPVTLPLLQAALTACSSRGEWRLSLCPVTAVQQCSVRGTPHLPPS